MIEDIINNDKVNELKKFKHHYGTTRFQHSLNVSYYNYKICKFLNYDAKSAARAGLLHDLFLYERKSYERQKGEKFHNSRHPKIALENAKKLFFLNNTEEDIILKHMWPCTIKLPKYKETVVIILVDKYCAILEISNFVLNKLNNLKFLRKSYAEG